MRRTPKRLAAAILLSAAGCTSDFGSKRDTRDDPLLGIGSRPGSQPVAAQPAPSYNPPPAYTPTPPITQGTPTSNAALASGGFQPLAGSSDLRIGNGSPTLSAPNNSPSTISEPRPVNGPGPAPVNGVRPAPPPASYPGATNSIGPRGGLESAYAAVAAVAPNWHKLTFNSQSREYLFSMSVPNKQNSSVPRTVEATAGTPEQAIRAALEQLGREPQ